MNSQKLDYEISKNLPTGCSILSVTRHGETRWSTGYRIGIKDLLGQEHRYFLKVLERKRGDEMARGEYESGKALMKHIPEAISDPIAWGTLESDSSKSFYLTRYCDLIKSLPRNSDLLDVITKLHQESISPTGKFGFHVTTFYGCFPMDNTWTDSWEDFFIRDFQGSVQFAQMVVGDDEELNELASELVAKVIPRLLRPLQMGHRQIKPSLCFGDFWDANVHTDQATGKPFLFDPCCLYGHHEMDLQCLRANRYNLGPDFVREYASRVGPSEPKGDFDDRNALYSLADPGETKRPFDYGYDHTMRQPTPRGKAGDAETP